MEDKSLSKLVRVISGAETISSDEITVEDKEMLKAWSESLKAKDDSDPKTKEEKIEAA